MEAALCHVSACGVCYLIGSKRARLLKYCVFANNCSVHWGKTWFSIRTCPARADRDGHVLGQACIQSRHQAFHPPLSAVQRSGECGDGVRTDVHLRSCSAAAGGGAAQHQRRNENEHCPVLPCGSSGAACILVVECRFEYTCLSDTCLLRTAIKEVKSHASSRMASVLSSSRVEVIGSVRLRNK